MLARQRAHSRRGFTLVEVMIAMIIALVLIAGIYQFFTRQGKIYSVQDETSRMQQSARIAQDFMLKAIQQSGAFTDESLRGPAILAAGDHYLTVQYNDPYGLNPTIDGEEVEGVTAGEVVTFVIASSDPGASPVSHFVSNDADYDTNATSGVVEMRYFEAGSDYEYIDDNYVIEYLLDKPPYTLYMITPDPNGTGNPPVWEPVATNVENLHFRYYDHEGQALPRDEDTNEALEPPYVLSAEDRLEIRAVDVELMLRAGRMDLDYTDDTVLTKDTVGTYVAGVPTGATPAPIEDNYRRRTYRTRIVPRNLDVQGCGTILLEANEDPQCPDPAILTATVFDRYGDPLTHDADGNVAKITYTIMDNDDCQVAEIEGVRNPVPRPLDANGQDTVTLTYDHEARTIQVLAQVDNIDCRPLDASATVTGAATVDFLPGDEADMVMFKLLNAGEEGDQETCSGDYRIEFTPYDECGNMAPGNFSVSSTLDDLTTPFGRLELNGAPSPGSNPLSFSGGTSTVVIDSYAAISDDTFRNTDGTWSQHVFIDAVPADWLTNGDVIRDGGVFWGDAPACDHEGTDYAVGDTLALLTVKPWPPDLSTFTRVDDVIAGTAHTDCPTGAARDTFSVADCIGNTIWTLDSNWTIEAALTMGGTGPDKSGDYGLLSSSNGGPGVGPGDAITITASETTDHLYELIYEPPTCSTVIGPIGSDADPSFSPDLSVKLVDGLGGTEYDLPVTPTVAACETCIVTTPGQVTTCQETAEIVIDECIDRLGGTDYVDEDGNVLVTYKLEATGGAPDMFWEGIVSATATPPTGTLSPGGASFTIDPANPNIIYVTPGYNVGENFFRTRLLLALGQTAVGDVITITASAVQKDPTTGDVVNSWTCDTKPTITVDNQCVAGSFYAKGVDVDGNEFDIRDGEPICSVELAELKVGLEHCITVDTRTGANPEGEVLSYPVTVETYNENGDLFDREEIVLQAYPGSTHPVVRFEGDIDVIANDFSLSGTVSGKLEYKDGQGGELWIHPWVNEFSPDDSCPNTTWKMPLSPPIPLCFPNAITSGGGADWNGNFLVHWGDVVVRGRMDAPAKTKQILKGNGGTIQFDGKPFGGAGNSDRFVDVYIGKSLDPAFADCDGNIYGVNPTNDCETPPDPTAVHQPYKTEGYGNYYTNLSWEKITEMIVALNYDEMRNLAIDHSLNSYWVSVDLGAKYPGYYNPQTDVLIADLFDLLDLTDVNPNNDGEFLFIDTWGVKNPDSTALPRWFPPVADDASINLDALADTLPYHFISGSFFTEGILYIAGSLEFGGLGETTDVTVETPPQYDFHYDHNVWSPTEDDLPVRPDPQYAQDSKVVSVHINGAVYVDGSYQGLGNPAVFGALTSERGYGSGGSPEVWYNYTLNEGGLQGSLCVECCDIEADPAAVDLAPGDSRALTITGAGGTGKVLFQTSDPGVATVTDTGIVTAVAQGFAVVWAVDENNCTASIPVRVSIDCVGMVIEPSIVPEPGGPPFEFTDLTAPAMWLEMQHESDPAQRYELAFWDWSILDDDGNVLTIEPDPVVNHYSALIEGVGCGTVTVKATDNTGVCDGIYESVVTVSSALDVVGISPEKDIYFVGEPVMLTADFGLEPYEWFATPSVAASFNTSTSNPTEITFLSEGTIEVQVRDARNCNSFTIYEFEAACPHPAVETVEPVLTDPVQRVGVNSRRGGYMVWQAVPDDGFGTDPLDQIERLEFVAVNEQSGAIQHTRTGYSTEYCGFNNAGTCAAQPGDISTWPTGYYTLDTTAWTTPEFHCAPDSATSSSRVLVDNCTLYYTDDFFGVDPNRWHVHCPPGGCDPLQTRLIADGNNMIVRVENTMSSGPALVSPDRAGPVIGHLENFIFQTVVNNFIDPLNTGEYFIGLTVRDENTPGSKHFTITGVPVFDPVTATTTYGMRVVYNDGTGEQVLAPSVVFGTAKLQGPITINIIRQEGGYGAQAWDFMGNQIDWLIYGDSTSLVPIDMSDVTHPMILVKGPNAFPSTVEAYIDWFGIACYAW